MRFPICLAFSALITGLNSSSAADLPLKNGDRIIMGGDSIQDGSMQPHYMAAYLILRNPSRLLHIQTEARGGLGPEGWLDPSGPTFSHYSRRIAAYEPDYFSISTSTNNGLNEFKAQVAFQDLVDNYALPQGAKVILYGGIPSGDVSGSPVLGEQDRAIETVALSRNPSHGYYKAWLAMAPRFTERKVFSANALTDTLTSFAHGFSNKQPVLLNIGAVGGLSNGVRYYVRDADANSFKLAALPNGPAIDLTSNGTGTNSVSNVWPHTRRLERQDDLHPGPAANIAYAWKLITGLGWGTDVSSATLNASNLSVTAQDFCTISGLKMNAQGGIDFTRLDQRLPWAIDEEGRADALFLYPEMAGWQKYSLAVTGLQPGTYDIYISDRKVASLTAAQLQAGWNMADLSSGPIWEQCQEVLGRIRDMHDRSRQYPFASLHVGLERRGVEKYRGAVDNAFGTLNLRGAALAADPNVQAALHRVPRAVAVNPSTDVLTDNGHPFREGELVRIQSTGTPPAPLTANTDYYVVNKSVSTYKLAAARGSSPIDITDSGSGTASVYAFNNIDDLDAAIQAAAQPVPRVFSIRAQGSSGGGSTGQNNTDRYIPPPGIPAPVWGAFDPINSTPPARPAAWPDSAAAGYYYIDNTASGATDTNNPNGYPGKPRLTIPEITYSAGSYMEIHGGPYSIAGGDAELDLTFAGTEASPCWVTGTSAALKPELRGTISISGSYAVIRWLHNAYNKADDRRNFLDIGGDPKFADHICIRECLLAGDGQYHAGFGANVGLLGADAARETNNIVIYDVESKDADNFDYVKTTGEDDQHGAHVGFFTNNVWFLKFRSHNNAGDGMQVSGNNAKGEARVQRLFIGDSEFYHNAENSGIDMKSSLDVIISRNKIYDCTESKGGGGGSLCITQDEGGDGCDNVWIMFNQMHDAINPLRVEGNSTDIHLIGNMIWNMNDQIIPARSVEDGYSGFIIRSNEICTARVVDNTFVRMASSGLRWKAVGTAPRLRAHGNIFALRTNPTGWDLWGAGSSAEMQIDYTLYDSTAPRWYLITSYGSLDQWRLKNARGWDLKSISDQPGFMDVPAGDFRLTRGSPAVDANLEDPAYARFQERYGLNIRFDILGTPRPQGKGWDIGAYEFIAGRAPAPPTGLRVTKKN